MKCRQCGTDIAEKALICYKCGTATTEAKHAPVPISERRRTPAFALLVALIVLLLGVYIGETGTTATIRTSGWSVAVAAVVALAAWRGLRRS